MFESRGYAKCPDGAYDAGTLKIALYAAGNAFFHVARQLRDGSWSSKAGELQDFRHGDPEKLEGSSFMGGAKVALFMSRADPGDSMELQEHGLIVPDGSHATSTSIEDPEVDPGSGIGTD